MTLSIGLESSRERKGLGGIFFGIIYHLGCLGKKAIFRAIFGSRKIQSSSSSFWCHKNQQVCSSNE